MRWPVLVQLRLTACNQNPNSIWIPSADGRSGVCHCCRQDGTAYLDQNEATAPCKACTQNTTHCGDNGGFCKGGTGNPNIPCVQNPTTKRWAPQCTGICAGTCPGACGLSEWVAFSRCGINTTTRNNQCRASISQWKSWLVYGLIFLFLILLIIIVVVVTRPRRPSQVHLPPGSRPLTAQSFTIV